MKTLGLIGGTGWVSTIEYYKLINAGINARLGGLSAARLLLYSLNYADVDKANQNDDRETVFALILDAARKLQNSGVDGLMLCANTTHMFAERLNDLVPLPIIHIGEATAKVIQFDGLKKVALLGTKFTMEMDFYRDKLMEAGIQMMVPEKDDREFIHAKIMGELLKDEFKPETKAYESLGGFATIGSIFPAKWDWFSFWNMTAFISIILAIMNLLPIPALDGGHVMFLLFEMISGKKPGEKFMEYAQIAGMVLLLALVLYANANDIIKMINGTF